MKAAPVRGNQLEGEAVGGRPVKGVQKGDQLEGEGSGILVKGDQRRGPLRTHQGFYQYVHINVYPVLQKTRYRRRAPGLSKCVKHVMQHATGFRTRDPDIAQRAAVVQIQKTF